MAQSQTLVKASDLTLTVFATSVIFYRHIVLLYMVTHHLALPYAVLCNTYKQYIVGLESFVSKNMINL